MIGNKYCFNECTKLKVILVNAGLMYGSIMQALAILKLTVQEIVILAEPLFFKEYIRTSSAFSSCAKTSQGSVPRISVKEFPVQCLTSHFTS